MADGGRGAETKTLQERGMPYNRDRAPGVIPAPVGRGPLGRGAIQDGEPGV
jgi:hypothetical protein